MDFIPNDAEKTEVTGSSVDFFKKIEDGLSTYYFDTSKTGPPAPMVNAMCGLKVIKGTNGKLVMINHKAPGGLFEKLGEDVAYNVEDIEGGLVRVTFSSIKSTDTDSDLDAQSCDG